MMFLGAMSGTSTDAVDVALLSFEKPSSKVSQSSLNRDSSFTFLGTHQVSFSSDLRTSLLGLQAIPPRFHDRQHQAPSDVLAHMLNVRRELTEVYARASQELLGLKGVKAKDVMALGAHGQTLRHQPHAGFTYQMLDAALLSSLVGVPVVSDFRAKDVAYGGQGAPLACGFHQAWLGGCNQNDQIVVLNLGGFANITVLAQDWASTTGGDCGPASSLMDAWANHAFGLDMDRDGIIAASGQVCQPLLEILWEHSFFRQPFPKSTGREDFSLSWVLNGIHLVQSKMGSDISPQDVMRTLLELTVLGVACTIGSQVKMVWVCGGGAYNPIMLALLQTKLRALNPNLMVQTTDALGMPASAVEAYAFAWLAARHVQKLPGNCPLVTGAKQGVVLGSLVQPH